MEQMEKLKEVFELLGIDSDWKETDSSDCITTTGNLIKVADLLKDIHDVISQEAKDLIAKRVLALESACDNVLQLLPEHRSTRGRTGGATPGRKTESGYSSACSSATSQALSASSAVLLIHDNAENDNAENAENDNAENDNAENDVEEKTFEQPTRNGSSEFAPTNGAKRVVKVLTGKQETTTENQTDGATNCNLTQETTLENQTDAATSCNPVQETTLENPTDAATSRNPVENEEIQ